jgi:hypothetical protein
LVCCSKKNLATLLIGDIFKIRNAMSLEATSLGNINSKFEFVRINLLIRFPDKTDCSQEKPPEPESDKYFHPYYQMIETRTQVFVKLGFKYQGPML